MDNYIVEYSNDLPDWVSDKVLQGHVADEAANGVICNYKSFSLIVKNTDNNIVGVLSAYVAYSEIYVDDIWVDPDYRGCGFGSKLLSHLENQFKDKGYNNINLVTSQFQAVEFYKKCGFEIEFVRINKCNPKLTKMFFIKYFNEKHQTQGLL